MAVIRKQVVASLVLASVSLLSMQIAPAQDRKVHFVIDPGHGGKDPGSQRNGATEKELTLDLAKRVEMVLKGRSYSATLTRDSDVFVPLEERGAKANVIPNSIFISLHFNSHTDRRVAGIETFYWPGSVLGQQLASFIQGELRRRIVTRDRGFKPEELKVLEVTQGPAVLVECGFLSNRWECQRCKSAWFKQVLAEEIAQALIRFSKLSPRPDPAPTSTAPPSSAPPAKEKTPDKESTTTVKRSSNDDL